MRKLSNLITFAVALPMTAFAAVYLAAAATTALKPGAIAQQQRREMQQAHVVKVEALELQQQQKEAEARLNHRVAHCPVNLVGNIPERTDPRYGEWLSKQAMASAEDLATQDGFNPGQWYLYLHKGQPLLAIKGTVGALEVATAETHPNMNAHVVCNQNRLRESPPEIDRSKGLLTAS